MSPAFFWCQGQGAFLPVELSKLIHCLFVCEQRVTDTKDSIAARGSLPTQDFGEVA